MKKAPYEFVLNALKSIEIQIKPMFGAFAVLNGDTILMILRRKGPADLDTGVWFGVPDEYVLDIKTEFPILKDIVQFGTVPTPWQVVRESEPSFKEFVLNFCNLILKKDKRIGRILKAKTPGKKKLVIPKKIKVKDNQ